MAHDAVAWVAAVAGPTLAWTTAVVWDDIKLKRARRQAIADAEKKDDRDQSRESADAGVRRDLGTLEVLRAMLDGERSARAADQSYFHAELERCRAEAKERAAWLVSEFERLSAENASLRRPRRTRAEEDKDHRPRGP